MHAVFTTHSVDETSQLGGQLGARLRGGEWIELTSDLGGGKTTLTKAIVAGSGSTDIVTSPTFTVSKRYTVPAREESTLRTIVHSDLYRLQDPGLMAHEIAELHDDPTATVIIEWADVAHDVLPVKRLKIELVATSENNRRVIIDCPEALSYMLEGLT